MLLLLAAVFEPCLLANAIQGTGGEVVIARPRDGDEAGFRRVFELLMATPRAGEDPAVVGEYAKEVADFHGQTVRDVDTSVQPATRTVPRELSTADACAQKAACCLTLYSPAQHRTSPPSPFAISAIDR